MKKIKRDREKAVDIVRLAGGKIIGRTKLQKIAYLLELSGQGEGFEFEYRHYGPYSETLADAVNVAVAFGLINEEECIAQWGGRYSVYKIERTEDSKELAADEARAEFASAAAEINSVELELAATAAYLYDVESCREPWEKTKRLKPEKASGGRLERAKKAYRELLKFETPKSLPKIV